MAIEITVAAEEDIPAFLEIEQACFTDPWSKAGFYASVMSGGVNVVLKAARDGEILGFIIADRVCGESNILNLAVRPDSRRQGIARALLNALHEEIKAAVYMLEVRESNLPAVALYKKLGFEIVGMRKGYYRNPPENAVLMTKNVLTL